MLSQSRVTSAVTSGTLVCGHPWSRSRAVGTQRRVSRGFRREASIHALAQSQQKSQVPWNSKHRPTHSVKYVQHLPKTLEQCKDALVGFRVLHMQQRRQRDVYIGIVDDVIIAMDSGSLGQQDAQMLLKVMHPIVHEVGNQSFTVEEEHLIPLVQSIVPEIRTDQEEIVVDPPDGLLDLGRRNAQIEILRHVLDPIMEELAEKKKSIMDDNDESFTTHTQTDQHNTDNDTITKEDMMMPTRKELEDMGRRDVVRLIQRAGGFLDVAQCLGYRSVRKPPGYWEDETALDRELSLFVGAHWVKFHAMDEDEEDQVDDEHAGSYYWFNTVTRRMRWTQPMPPQIVEIDDQGTELFAESDEDRAMPSRSSLVAAGRYDLHTAIVAAGGYNEVADMLDRWPAWPPTQRLRNKRNLKSEIRDFIREHALPKRVLPCASDFLDLGRPDLHQAVLRAGGYTRTAHMIGYANHRRKRGEWKDFDAVCRAIQEFVASKSHQPINTMPTHEELRRAGRHDLRHALQKHGSVKVAEALGFDMSRRGGYKNRRKKLSLAMNLNPETTDTD
jgi:hypothetical protein